MATVTIYGASDDLIEIEGDISDEFNPNADEETHIVCSDGTVLRVTYDGCWRFVPVSKGSAKMTKKEAVSADSDEYSDRVTLDGPITWVAMADSISFMPKSKRL